MTMNKEQGSIIIAEVCGWYSYINADLLTRWYNRNTHQDDDEMPDYSEDLNAIHEAEKYLTDEQYTKYEDHIWDIVLEASDYYWEILKNNESRPLPRLSSPTAAQRAEAFLKTIGKWEETNE